MTTTITINGKDIQIGTGQILNVIVPKRGSFKGEILDVDRVDASVYIFMTANGIINGQVSIEVMSGLASHSYIDGVGKVIIDTVEDNIDNEVEDEY